MSFCGGMDHKLNLLATAICQAELLHQSKGNVINYFALCACVVDLHMLINHLLQKNVKNSRNAYTLIVHISRFSIEPHEYRTIHLVLRLFNENIFVKLKKK